MRFLDHLLIKELKEKIFIVEIVERDERIWKFRG